MRDSVTMESSSSVQSRLLDKIQNSKKKYTLSTLEAQKTLLLRTLCKEASDVSAFVMDVKRLMETSIKHNRINVPLDHLGANKVWASKKIQHKSQLVI